MTSCIPVIEVTLWKNWSVLGPSSGNIRISSAVPSNPHKSFPLVSAPVLQNHTLDEIRLSKLLPFLEHQGLPTSCKDAIVTGYQTFLDGFEGEEGCERLGHVDRLHNAAEVFGKDLSLNVCGIEQVSGKSEGWTWVDDARFCVSEAK